MNLSPFSHGGGCPATTTAEKLQMAQIHFIGGQQHGKAQQIGLEVPDIPAGYMEHSRTYSPPDAEVLADECMIFLVHENIAQNGITARQEAVAAYWAEFEKQNLKA